MVGTSDLLTDPKKYTTKSREAISLGFIPLQNLEKILTLSKVVI
jgi:hypothetical protein